MSERYGKLYSLPEKLYAEGAPVIISAGNLLKDTQTGKVLAQLKIKNISSKTIKAAKVLIRTLDTTGKPMDGDTEKNYLDLSAGQGEDFGQKEAVSLPDDAVRRFRAEVTYAAFSDDSTWEGSAAPWEPLPEAVSLEKELGDEELVRQYRLKYGAACESVPQKHKDLWLCACGAWNRGEKCYACGKGKETLLSLDLDALKADRDVRLAQEKAERETKEAADKAAAEASRKKTKKLFAILAPALVFCLAALLILTKVVIPNSNYNKAQALLEEGKYDQALAAFEAMNGYKDSTAKIAEVNEAKTERENEAAYETAVALMESGQYDRAILIFQRLGGYRDSAAKIDEGKEKELQDLYAQAESLLKEGKPYEAVRAFFKIKDYGDSLDRCVALWGKITDPPIAAGQAFSAGLCSDGTVITAGDNIYGQCDAAEWEDVVAIATGQWHTAALFSDGTVKATGYNEYGQCDVSEWEQITAISAGQFETVGLKEDGTVVAIGRNQFGQCDTSSWTRIVSISIDQTALIGLRDDGTVVAAGDNTYGQCNVFSWDHIVAVAAGGGHVVGLKEDGTVLAAGSNKYGQCDVKEWKDVVAIAAGAGHTVGLISDGTVIAAGYNESGQCDVSGWKNITAIAAGKLHTLGLCADGTVVAVGYNEFGQCDVSEWKNIKRPG